MRHELQLTQPPQLRVQFNTQEAKTFQFAMEQILISLVMKHTKVLCKHSSTVADKIKYEFESVNELRIFTNVGLSVDYMHEEWDLINTDSFDKYYIYLDKTELDDFIKVLDEFENVDRLGDPVLFNYISNHLNLCKDHLIKNVC